MRFKILIALCSLSLSACIVQSNLNEHLLQEEEYLGECIKKIITHVNLTKSNIDATVVNFQTVAQSRLFTKIQNLRYITRSFQWSNNTMVNSLYIINSDDYTELENGIKSLKQDFFWNPTAMFIIAISNLKDNLHELSLNLLEHYMFNVTVLKRTVEDYEIFTFNPTLDACGIPAMQTLESTALCSKITRKTNIFNAETPKSFKGCNITLVGQEFWPWLSFNKTRKRRMGVSHRALQLWDEFAGVNAEVVEYDQNGSFGRVTENYTLTGMLRWIEEKKSVGAIGGYSLTYDRAKVFDYTYPYSIDRAIAVVAKAGVLTNWRAVIIQFTWYSTIIIFMFIIFFCYAVANFSIFNEKKEDVARGILIVFGYLCGNMRYKYIKSDISLRLVVCCLLLFVFFLSFLIQAYLSSATTNPTRSHQIKHLHEALTKCKPLKNWTWQAIFRPNDTQPFDFDCESLLDCLTKVKDSNKRLYVVTPEVSYMTHSWKFLDKSGELQIYPIQEPVINMYRVLYFRRGAPISKSYSRLLEFLQENMLLRHDFYSLINEDRLKFLIHLPDADADRSPEKLSDLLEIFSVLVVGYTVALMTFIYECRSIVAYYFGLSRNK